MVGAEKDERVESCVNLCEFYRCKFRGDTQFKTRFPVHSIKSGTGGEQEGTASVFTWSLYL